MNKEPNCGHFRKPLSLAIGTARSTEVASANDTAWLLAGMPPSNRIASFRFTPRIVRFRRKSGHSSA